MTVNSSPTSTTAPRQHTRLLRRSTTARRVLAISTALPFVLSLAVVFLPPGGMALLVRVVGLVLLGSLIYPLRAATRWTIRTTRTLDEREQSEMARALNVAYQGTMIMFAVLILVGVLGRVDVVPTLTTDQWIFLVGVAGVTHLLLPFAVHAWRLTDGRSDA